MKRIISALICVVMLTSLSAQVNLLTIPKIKLKFTLDQSGDTASKTEYTYDNRGRCIRVDCSNGTESYVEEIEYPDNSTVVVYYKDVAFVKTTTYKLNAKGQAISIQEVEDGNELNDQYLYNAAGFSIKLGNVGMAEADEDLLKVTKFNINEHLTVINGNVTKNELNEEFTFYINKANTLGNKNFGLGFLGNDNKNLVKDMNGIEKGSYTYEFDAKGRAIKQTETISGVVTHFKY